MAKNTDKNITLQQQVKSFDYERWLTVHYAPASKRAALFALLAFNLDLSRIIDTAREPMLAEIKLVWWRDRLSELWVDAITPAHPILQAFVDQAVIKAVPLTLMHEMIDGRIVELYREGPHTVEAIEAYAAATGGALAEAMAYCLTGRYDQQARQVGTYYAVVLTAIQRNTVLKIPKMILKMRQDTLAVDLQVVLARDYSERKNILSGRLIRQFKMLWASIKT